MSLLRLPRDAKFTTKAILLFLLPIFFEQVVLNLLGSVDTLLISRLAPGYKEIATAGIANVSRLDTLIKTVIVALAAGGSIFTAQYVGAEKYDKANRAMKLSAISLFALSLLLSLVLFVVRRPLLSLLYPTVDPAVMEQSVIYYSASIFSYPAMAIFYTGTASYRAMGKSKITFYSSAVMMSVSLLAKWLFIFPMNMGVFGAGLSLLFSFGLTGIGLLLLLCRKSNLVHFENLRRLEWDWGQVKKIYRVALPSGIENGIFQLGSLLLQTLVAALGTDANNANHLAHVIQNGGHAFAATFTLGVVPFISQSMGAKDPDAADMYAKHIIAIEILVLTAVAMIAFPLTPFILSFFEYSEAVTADAVLASRIYLIGLPLLYTLSYSTPAVLRGAGDTRFPMIVSIATMFLFRIGFAYLLVYVFDLGFLALWVAMVADWLIRSVIFLLRYFRGGWRRRVLVD